MLYFKCDQDMHELIQILKGELPMEEYIIHINKKEKTETLKHIEEAIHELSNYSDEIPHEKLVDVFESIRLAICHNDKVMIPVDIPEDIHLKLRSLELNNGKLAYACFTNHDEAMAGGGSSTITQNLEALLERTLMNPIIDGIIFNPWNESFFLSNEHIRAIFNANVPRHPENIISIQTLDITQADTTCIVNAANETLLGGGGVDGAIHRAAGRKLLEECRTLNGCKTGEAKITKGYNLKADYVIHTVGPIYSGSPKDAKLLRNCYWNSLELAKMNDIHSIAFPAISTGVYGYPLKDATDIAIKTVTDWLKINPHHGMAILFACFDMKTKDIYDRIWDKYEKSWNERPILRENDGKLEEAIQMAMNAHKGAVRKGTTKPYILHPIETVQILSSMDADINLLIAGILHDTLEDTDTTCLDIYDKFGVDVAALVNEHTEDKRKTWYMRKLIKTTFLPNETIRSKMLTIADKVANMRNMLTDYNAIGEDFWNRFNAPKHLQAWYYSNLCDGLEELQDYENTKAVYAEMMQLYKDLFV